MKYGLVSTNECKKQNSETYGGFPFDLKEVKGLYVLKNDIIFFRKKTNPTVASST